MLLLYLLRWLHVSPQWGSLDFHKKSLSNLGEAMRKTRKLCAVVIDTIGRELIVNRPTVDEVDGWPKFDKGISVKAEDKVERPLTTVCQMSFCAHVMSSYTLHFHARARLEGQTPDRASRAEKKES